MSDLDNPEWLQRIALLTKAKKTWHRVVLPEGAVPDNIKVILFDNSNIGNYIGNYIWDTSELLNKTYWSIPIKNCSSARTIYFENKADIVMFKLLM